MSGTDFLYPFLEAQEVDPEKLIGDLTHSATAKLEESAALREATLSGSRDAIDSTATAIAERIARGGLVDAADLL